MPLLVLNDEALTSEEGDNLLDVARAHGSHVWFVCDGRGVCRTCACRVLSGAENLSAPTPIEMKSLSESERDDGYRLACQAWLVGRGDVRVLGVAEQLRRAALEIARPKGSRGESILRFIREAGGVGLSAATGLPGAATHVIPQLVAMPPTPSGVLRYIADTQRLVWRMLTDAIASSASRQVR